MKKQFFDLETSKEHIIRILPTKNTGMSYFQSFGRSIRETRESKRKKKIKNIFND
jgi:hypothetical protein